MGGAIFFSKNDEPDKLYRYRHGLADHGQPRWRGLMVGDARGRRLEAVSAGITSMDELTDYVVRNSGSATVIAIDASLIVKNATGQRPCETAVSARFGKYHASCHTSNTSRLHHDTIIKLVERLKTLGFNHQFDLGKARLRVVAVLIHQFILEQVKKYSRPEIGRFLDKHLDKGIRQSW